MIEHRVKMKDRYKGKWVISDSEYVIYILDAKEDEKYE